MEDTTIKKSLETFEKYYAEKDYQSALHILKEHENEIPAGILNYNLGTTYARLEQWSLARYHLLKAENEGFDHDKLYQNQEIVNQVLQVKQNEKALELSDFFYQGSLIAAEGLFTTVSLLVLVIGIWFARKQNKLQVVILTLILAGLPLAGKWWVSSLPKGVIVNNQVIYEGPSAIFEARAEVPSGLFVIYKKKDNWYQILYPSRYRGWMKTDGLKSLE